MAFTQIVYASRPFGFDGGTLHDILTVSRANNARDDITGALVCRADLYLQLIEGPDAAIAALFARIGGDDRHVEVRTLASRSVTTRLFPEWAMRDDPPRSWMWTPEAVLAGALDAVTADEALAVFERLAAEPT